MKMTIIEAIKEVMRLTGKPMTVNEVYEQILKNRLYQFKAADPVHIVNSQIRRHCKGIPEQKSYSKTKHFQLVGSSEYYLLESSEVIDREEKSVYKEYLLPKFSKDPISSKDIRSGSIEFQAEVLKEWFLSEYEPAIKDSQGGYIYLLDGPYEAVDVLSTEFSSVLDIEALSKIAEDLEGEFGCKEWSKIPKDRDVEEYFLESLNTEFYRNFSNTIRSIKMLSAQSNVLKEEIEKPFNRMLYASIITAMESYLSDAFISAIRCDESNCRKLIEETPELRDRSLKLGDIYRRMDSIPKEVDDYLLGLVYHRLDKVKELYYHTLGIEFPRDLSKIFRAILTRHDIVHRNGKRQDGSAVTIGRQEIHSLSSEVTDFIKKVDEQLKDKRILKQ